MRNRFDVAFLGMFSVLFRFESARYARNNLLALMIVFVLFMPAFGIIQIPMAFGQSTITVQTDKGSYALNEYVEVSGKVSNYNAAEGKTVRLDMFNPEGGVMYTSDNETCCRHLFSDQKVKPDEDGMYLFKFFLHGGDELVKPGLHTIQATYDGKSIETETTFQVKVFGAPTDDEPEPELPKAMESVSVGGQPVDLEVESSSTIDDFEFDEEAKQITFTISGDAGTEGITIITIERVLIGPYIVVIGDRPVTDFEVM